MRRYILIVSSIALASLAGMASGTVLSTITYSACDAFCTNPRFVNWTVHDDSPLSFADSRGSVFAQTDYGVWKASAESTYVPDVTGTSFESESAGTADSTWFDTITFEGGSGAGQATVDVAIDGSIGVTGNGVPSTVGSMFFDLLLNGQTLLALANDTNNGISVRGGSYDPGTGILSATFNFEYGTPYDIGGTLEASGSFGGYALFGHTALLSFALPEGTGIVSAANASYDTGTPSVIPEPGTLPMLVIALLGVVLTYGTPRISSGSRP